MLACECRDRRRIEGQGLEPPGMLQGGVGGRTLGRPWNGEMSLKGRLSPGPEKGLL